MPKNCAAYTLSAFWRKETARTVASKCLTTVRLSLEKKSISPAAAQQQLPGLKAATGLSACTSGTRPRAAISRLAAADNCHQTKQTWEILPHSPPLPKLEHLSDFSCSGPRAFQTHLRATDEPLEEKGWMISNEAVTPSALLCRTEHLLVWFGFNCTGAVKFNRVSSCRLNRPFIPNAAPLSKNYVKRNTANATKGNKWGGGQCFFSWPTFTNSYPMSLKVGMQGRSGHMQPEPQLSRREVKKVPCLSLSVTYLKLFPHIDWSYANSLSRTGHHWLELLPNLLGFIFSSTSRNNDVNLRADCWSKWWHICFVAFRVL